MQGVNHKGRASSGLTTGGGNHNRCYLLSAHGEAKRDFEFIGGDEILGKEQCMRRLVGSDLDPRQLLERCRASLLSVTAMGSTDVI